MRHRIGEESGAIRYPGEDSGVVLAPREGRPREETIFELACALGDGHGPTRESSASHTIPGRRLRERLEDFRRWVTAAGVFATETTHSNITEREHPSIQFPMLTRIESEDCDRRFVRPLTDGDTGTAVPDRFNAIEATTAVHQAHTTRRSVDDSRPLSRYDDE